MWWVNLAHCSTMPLFSNGTPEVTSYSNIWPEQIGSRIQIFDQIRSMESNAAYCERCELWNAFKLGGGGGGGGFSVTCRIRIVQEIRGCSYFETWSKSYLKLRILTLSFSAFGMCLKNRQWMQIKHFLTILTTWGGGGGEGSSNLSESEDSEEEAVEAHIAMY